MRNDDKDAPTSELILYRSEDAQTRIQVRLEGESVWLTQRQIAELFQVSVPTINEHLGSIFSEGELEHERTIRRFRIVQAEGERQVRRTIDHYNLDAILAVGYRVRSARGTQFRQWATARLSEYLVKGFALDDERLKRWNRRTAGTHAPPAATFRCGQARRARGPGSMSRDYLAGTRWYSSLPVLRCPSASSMAKFTVSPSLVTCSTPSL
ncbi:hypothetical protein NB689_000989 [Xanthomonas sacchari]|nr:hypothetical protein [Xanthomonas sacchari]MCW0415235.1 hypothetical protein [Xanthomonas sacchari]